jgi:hypothetical protein
LSIFEANKRQIFVKLHITRAVAGFAADPGGFAVARDRSPCRRFGAVSLLAGAEEGPWAPRF